MKRIFATPFLITTLLAVSPPLDQAPAAAEQTDTKVVDYCRNRGARFELGESSCIRVGNLSEFAICDMSQNSPSWRKTAEACAPQANSE